MRPEDGRVDGVELRIGHRGPPGQFAEQFLAVARGHQIRRQILGARELVLERVENRFQLEILRFRLTRHELLEKRLD